MLETWERSLHNHAGAEAEGDKSVGRGGEAGGGGGWNAAGGSYAKVALEADTVVSSSSSSSTDAIVSLRIVEDSGGDKVNGVN